MLQIDEFDLEELDIMPEKEAVNGSLTKRRKLSISTDVSLAPVPTAIAPLML